VGILKRFLFAFLLLFIPFVGYATTYTVCNSGCTGTVIQDVIDATDLNSDDILEVRADTEGGSKTYTENITIGSADSGTSGHPVIVRARSGDTITIDGDDVNTAIFVVSGSYITIDGFLLVNPGSYGFLVGGSSAVAKNSGVTIQNNTITATATANTSNSIDGIVVRYADTCTVYNNTYTTTTGTNANQYDGIYIQASTNVDVNKNTVELKADNWITEDIEAGHNDCIQVAGGNGSIAYGSTGNITVRNNTCYQNNAITKNRQFMYFEYEITGYLYVYNNVMWKPSSNGSYGLYRLTNGADETDNGTTYFYNNSMYIGGASAGCYATNVADSYIKGNICHINAGGSAAIITLRAVVADANVNNNIGYKTATASSFRLWNSEANAFYTFTQWQALGYDTNGTFTDPLFTDVDDPPNLALTSGSPAREIGVDLSGTFTTDILGNTRPNVDGAWDAGAYEYGADEETPTYYTVTISKTGDGCSINNGAFEVVATESIDAVPVVNNGWKGTWAGTCGATGVVSDGVKYTKTPTEDCTVSIACEEILIW